MDIPEHSEDRHEYNRIAIETARSLQRERRAFYKHSKGSEIQRERLFPSFDRTGLGVVLEYEKMGDRPVSRDLEARAETLGVEFEHLGLTLGTVLHGLKVSEVESPEAIRFVRDTLLERKVIFFRDQALTEDEHIAFGRKFGDLDAFPFGAQGENPFTLEIKHGRRSPGTENGWHTDVTWMERPSLGSIAQCIEMPPFGGDTLFSDSHACYLGLPRALQEELEWLDGVHDYRNFLNLGAQASFSEKLVREIKSTIPFGVRHPLLRTHPETGKTALYFHAGFLRHDSLRDRRTGKDLDAQSSRAIVQRFLHQHSRPEYICRFRWTPGSIAFWDNRAVQHYAVSDYYPHNRVLRRVTVSGDAPFYKPGPGESATGEAR